MPLIFLVAGFLLLLDLGGYRSGEDVLFELAQDLGNSLSLNETLSLLALRLKRMIPYDSLAIYVLRDDRLRAEYASFTGASKPGTKRL